MGKKLRREIGYWLDSDLPTCEDLTLEGHSLCIRWETSTSPERECQRCEGQIRSPTPLGSWITRLWELKRLLALGVRVDLADLSPRESRGLLILEEQIERWLKERRRKSREQEVAGRPTQC